MKISRGMREQGVVVGNTCDKYGTRNPVARRLMRGFHEALEGLVQQASPATIHEIGCGEGYWVNRWRQAGFQARGSDFSARVIELARSNAASLGLSAEHFSVRSIYDLRADEDGADLLVCCEVLEHIEDPEAGLEALRRAAQRHVILSVPREPVWRMLNMARGRYLKDLGNTPGHIQHWSRSDFIRLVERQFQVVELRAPLPWTMLLCRVP